MMADLERLMAIVDGALALGQEPGAGAFAIRPTSVGWSVDIPVPRHNLTVAALAPWVALVMMRLHLSGDLGLEHFDVPGLAATSAAPNYPRDDDGA